MTNMVCLIEMCLLTLSHFPLNNSSQPAGTGCSLKQKLCHSTNVFHHLQLKRIVEKLQKMASGVVNCNNGEVPQSVSFSGSGFMATYQLGVAQCFLNYVPWILRTAPYVLGASAGSLVAAAVVCEMSPITIRDEIIHFAKQMKAFTLGPFNPSINVLHWLESILNKYLPPDAHQFASGRLAVAMTRLSDGKHIVMTEFQSKEDVVQALLCSCFVPWYCGILPPSFKGEYYVDGGFSGMQPVLSCSNTLTVSPFSGETDICPSDTPCIWDMVVSGSTLKGNMANSFRVINALYPMALETLDQAYYSGYKDTIDFLKRNGLAPYLMRKNISQGPLSSNQSKVWMHLETTTEEEEEMKEEQDKATLTSFTDNRHIQTGTAKVHSKRLQMLPSFTPELFFWAWHSLRHFFFFFFNTVVYSLKKNTKDRVMPVIWLLRWLKIKAVFEAARQTHSSTCNNSSAPSDNIKCGCSPRQLITPSRDYKKTKSK
ncbi:patatin-like phospholipase domain-containing protein 2 isoform X2 [Hippoglossus hippoglossus]|uniref:patatin-like phospholipase domain-containing protein 2 isoform X2 n=1 Tax=Hippoglossus hippoglossus TaxID=8267 RepID=UPI00148CD8CF|nr:patatin-like phospholipase domain-containing protein 2 isoform X2 [Hippoglossus hippoglossus]